MSFDGQIKEKFFQALKLVSGSGLTGISRVRVAIEEGTVVVTPSGTQDVNITQVGGTAIGTAIPVSVPTTTSTPTTTRVPGSASSVTLHAANTVRNGLSVYNDSTAILYVSYTTPATTTNQVVTLYPQGFWEMPEPVTTAAVYGIWASAAGGAQVTEAT